MRWPTPLALALLCLLPACSEAADHLYSKDARLLLGDGPQQAPASAPMDGLLFVAPLKSRFTYLLDGAGQELHRWESAYFPGAGTKLLEDGSILRCGRLLEHPTFTAGGQGGRLQHIAWDGALLWDYEFSSEEHLQHHDATMLPNGNVMFMAWERKTADEARANGRDPELQVDTEFWPDWIVEVEPQGLNGAKIVWEWHAWDHIIQDRDPSQPHFGRVADQPQRIDINGDRERVKKSDLEKAAEAEKMAALGYSGDVPPPPPPVADAPPDAPPGRPGREADWMHTNAIAYHPGLDLIAISVRRFSEIWVIDHSTTTAEAATSAGGRHGRGGDLLHRWGNPRAHKAGGDEDQLLFKQHHVQWIPSGRLGGGDFLCFNNGEDRLDENYSSIEEWRLPIDASGRISAGPAAPVWRYVAEDRKSFYSPFISGVERLPNGSTLITEGVSGRLLEVASDGKLLWEWSNTYGGEEEPKDDSPSSRVPPKALFRVSKIPLDHPVAKRAAR